MGEAQQHISPATDYMVSSWTLLLPPVETPPLPLKETFRATDKKRQPTAEVEVAKIIPIGDLRYCHFCNHPFLPTRKNQKFCTPDKERKPNWERRKALVVALAQHFKALGWHGCDLLTLAQACVDDEYDWVFGVMKKLGYEYGLVTKTWRKA